MSSLRLFDLHCDTLYECTRQDRSLISNDLQLSLERLSGYERFCQVMAVWSDHRIDEEEAWRRFFEARRLLERELSLTSEVRLCTDDASLRDCEREGVNALLLAVEGGRLLFGRLERLEELYRAGVRFLTLVWNGVCAIGGAHDTDEGLTDFGYEVVERCHTLGIIPDLSHSSALMCDQVLELCEERGYVCVATHSNSRAVCDHRRNLRDDQFCRIASLGGIVGVSLAPMHLTSSDSCGVCDVVRHIEHYLSLGGENAVCLGCDLDGVDSLPQGLNSVSDLVKIAEMLGQNNYSDSLIEKIFYANARNFISLWLK